MSPDQEKPVGVTPVMPIAASTDIVFMGSLNTMTRLAFTEMSVSPSSGKVYHITGRVVSAPGAKVV